MSDPQLLPIIQANVRTALEEDFGSGDLTASLIPASRQARASVISRENAVLCGIPWFETCFRTLDPDCRIDWLSQEGEFVAANQPLCVIHGNARALLSAERPALNFLQTLSATATLTRRYVEAVNGTRAKIMDTRKTLPGLRFAQKYAVRTGGGHNQRTGLFDGILQALKREAIPVAGADRIQLLDSLAVQDLLNLIRFALCPEDDLTLAEILKGPFGAFTSMARQQPEFGGIRLFEK